jgi:hypothetical protein
MDATVRYIGSFLPVRGFSLREAVFTVPTTVQILIKKGQPQTAVHQIQAVPLLLQQNQPDFLKATRNVY